MYQNTRNSSPFILLLSSVLVTSCHANQTDTAPATPSKKTPGSAPAATSDKRPGSAPAVKADVKPVKVELSPPVLVSRDTERVWFPTLFDLGRGRLLTALSVASDTARLDPPARFVWSIDNGKTWGKPASGEYPGSEVRVGGQTILLPSVLRQHPNGLKGFSQTVDAVNQTIRRAATSDILVTGLPRAPRAIDMDTGADAFGFTGRAIKLRDGSQLGLLYGRYVEDKQYYHLVAVTSRDGKNWRYLSTVATPAIIPRGWGSEGPCESDVVRLKDGRLMIIFRIGSGKTMGQAWSDDDGKTWTKPRIDEIGDASLLMSDLTVRSVQPSLVTLRDGTVVLSAGRPGVSVWINRAGDGLQWQRVDISAHHNRFQPQEPHVFDEGDATKHSTSGYTEIVAQPNGELLLIYDRLRGGWDNLVTDQTQTNSVWLVRLKIGSGT